MSEKRTQTVGKFGHTEVYCGKVEHGEVWYMGFSFCKHHCYGMRPAEGNKAGALMGFEKSEKQLTDEEAVALFANWTPIAKYDGPSHTFSSDGNPGNITIGFKR